MMREPAVSRGVVRLSTPGGQEAIFPQFFLILLDFLSSFLNLSPFFSSIWGSGWAGLDNIKQLLNLTPVQTILRHPGFLYRMWPGRNMKWWSLDPYQHNEIIKPFVSFELSKLCQRPAYICFYNDIIFRQIIMVLLLLPPWNYENNSMLPRTWFPWHL